MRKFVDRMVGGTFGGGLIFFGGAILYKLYTETPPSTAYGAGIGLVAMLLACVAIGLIVVGLGVVASAFGDD